MDVLGWVVAEIAGVAIFCWLMLSGVAAILGIDAVVRRWMLLGCFSGLLCGAVLGPIAMGLFMWYANSRYGTEFLGLELLGAPVLGAAAFAIPGAVCGVLTVMYKNRRVTGNGAV